MRLPAIDDHAFASGPVFLRPASFASALRLTRSVSGAMRLRAVWKQFDAGAHLGVKVRLGTAARLINRRDASHVRIGDESVLRGVIRVEAQGQLSLGEFVYLGDGALISAMSGVSIGSGTLIAHGVQIFDNDTHPIDAAERVEDFKKKLGYKPTRPIRIGTDAVTIGQRCWLGLHSIVMKGVSIGDDSIVASGSVVSKDVPSGTIVAGNPARIVRSLASHPE